LLITKTLQLLDAELEKIRIALDRVTDETVWQRQREGLNSIGNLCLHLAGNEQQNIVSSIGGEPNTRDRSAEFMTDGGRTCSELRDLLSDVRERSRVVLTALSDHDLSRTVVVEHPARTGLPSSRREIMELLYHVTTHYAYHTGQIVYITRLLQQQNEHLLK
jgi:uncharacterized damage-inducible protein DinB